MRAREFIQENTQGMTISIPINITIPAGGGMPTIGTIAAPATDNLPDQAVYVGPLQQELELMKQQGGKASKVINQIVNDNDADENEDLAVDSVQNHEETQEDLAARQARM
jgi:hypothetical protein